MTQVEYKSDSEKVVAVGITYPSAPTPLSLTEDPEIRRTRMKLIIILSILLALCVSSAIASIVRLGNSNMSTDNLQISQLGSIFTAILIHGFGILVAYRYARLGLLIFAWFNLIGLCVLGIVIVGLFFIIITVSAGKNYQTGPFGGSMSLLSVVCSIIVIVCIINFIISIFVVKLSFKLARLINKNNSLFVQNI